MILEHAILDVKPGLAADFDVEKDPIPPVGKGEGERKCRMLCKNCHITRGEWDPSAFRAEY